MNSSHLWLLAAGVGCSGLFLLVGILLTALVSGVTFAAAPFLVVGLIGWCACRRWVK